MTFEGNYSGQLDAVSWPPGLKRLTLSGSFDQPLDLIAWPNNLEELTFGSSFNQPTDTVQTWPPTLRRIAFGSSFRQPVDRVTLPELLEELEFNENGEQDIAGLKFPDTLKVLTVGRTREVDVRQLPHGIRLVRYEHYTVNELRQVAPHVLFPPLIGEIRL